MSRDQHYRAIWREGYNRVNEHETRERGLARLEGVAIGVDLADACRAHAEANPLWARAFNPTNLTHYGCRLFDNYEAARQRHG